MSQELDKSVVSFRIAVPVWRSETRFRELLTTFEKYKGVTDEVTFFTAESHSCLSLDLIEERAKILKDRMAEVRKLGYRSGINHLTTIGFFAENAAQSLKENIGERTYINGETYVGGRCSNDPAMQEYIRKLYRILVEAQPDYIWLDDDIHAGSCFCDHCLERFAKIAGRYYSREELRAAFNEGSIESKLNLRKKWIEHSGQTILELFTLVEGTVHEISPTMPLGIMTGDRFFEGYDFEAWARTLAGPNHVTVKWRPGEDFWRDDQLSELAQKAHRIGRQVSMIPDFVVDIQSEIENFMYQRLKKSKLITAIEPAVYIAAGATGTAFNVLQAYDQFQPEYDSLVAALHEKRAFYDLLVQTFGRSKPQGIYTGWNKNTFAGLNLSEGDWLSGNVRKIVGYKANEIFEIGLPAAYSFENAQATILIGEAVRSFSADDLEKILAGGAYIDADALTYLNQMGYGELTGFDVDKFHEADCIDKLVEHPLNGSFSGYERNGHQAFGWQGWNVPGAALIPKYEKSQILSRLINFAAEEIAPCTSGVFENKLGGRVCVAGYFPWTFVQYLFKSSQMKTLFRWLSKESLTAYVGSYHKVNLWSRTTAEGKQAIALLNSSLDAAENVEILIKTDRSEVSVYDVNCNLLTLKSVGNDGEYRKFVLPKILPFEMKLVCEK